VGFDTGTIVAGFVVGTIGLSVFVYGKKQARPPQLVAGLVLMGLPLVVASPWWLAGSSALVLGGTWWAVRRGA
jgi:hypothetical protein